MAKSSIKLNIRNLGGSVEHYFHFLLGFCVPLVSRYTKIVQRRPGIRMRVRDCGPMTTRLRDLGLPLDVASRGAGDRRIRGRKIVNLCGRDHPRRFSSAAFANFREFVAALPSEARVPEKPRSIIMIEREKSAAFYRRRAEKRGSGKRRRNVRNHGQLVSALAGEHSDFSNITLVGRTLKEQYLLFNSADLVIAQHGAALANIVFMKENAAVIEIGCPRSEDGLFQKLASTMGVRHYLLETDTPFPIVCPDALLRLTQRALAEENKFSPSAIDPSSLRERPWSRRKACKDQRFTHSHRDTEVR